MKTYHVKYAAGEYVVRAGTKAIAALLVETILEVKPFIPLDSVTKLPKNAVYEIKRQNETPE